MEQGFVGHGKDITSWNKTGAVGILSWRVVWSDYVIPGQLWLPCGEITCGRRILCVYVGMRGRVCAYVCVCAC